MRDSTVNRFRTARGRILRRQIDQLSAKLGRKIRILDVGGRSDYWTNVGLENIESILILNYDEKELLREAKGNIFDTAIGDARNLSRYPDKAFDLAHSNSVIEHVGGWQDMVAMASEVRRVGLSGWVQTPAWEFPIEPHFQAPFLHWFGQPMRRRMLSLSKRYRRKGVSDRRYHVDRINLVSRAEVGALFPDCRIITERVLLLPKSYIACW